MSAGMPAFVEQSLAKPLKNLPKSCRCLWKGWGSLSKRPQSECASIPPNQLLPTDRLALPTDSLLVDSTGLVMACCCLTHHDHVGDPDSSGDGDGSGFCGRKHASLSINKWAKPIPKLELPPRVHLQKGEQE